MSNSPVSVAKHPRADQAGARALPLQWWLAIALLAVVWVVYGRSAGFSFFVSWDDDLHVLANPYLRPLSWQGWLHFWTEPYCGLYAPISYSWFAALTWLAESPNAPADFGHLSPAVFHVGNICLHSLNTLLVYAWLIRVANARLKSDGGKSDGESAAELHNKTVAIAATLGAGMFALHPLQVESVAWISEARGLLSAAWSLAALLLIWKWFERAGNNEMNLARYSLPAIVWYGAATICFVLALLAKPSAVALPAAAALVAFFVQRARWSWIAAAMLPWCALALVDIWITHGQQPIFVEVSLVNRPIIALDSLSFYAQKFLTPWPLTIHYPCRPDEVLENPATLWKAAGVAVMLTLLLIFSPARLRPAIGWSVVWLLPVLGLIPFEFQKYSTVADRYAYMALLGPALAVALAYAHSRSRALLAGVGFVIAVWACLSWSQLSVWRDTETLFRHAVGLNPHSYRFHYDLGTLYLRQDRLAEARASLEKALAANDLVAEAHNHLGIVAKRENRFDDAVAHYQTALQIAPDNYSAAYNLSQAQLQLGKTDDALTTLEQFIGSNPGSVEARRDQIELALQTDRLDVADRGLRRMLQGDPDNVELLVAVGLLRLRQGRIPAGLTELTRIAENHALAPEVYLQAVEYCRLAQQAKLAIPLLEIAWRQTKHPAIAAALAKLKADSTQ